jgi:phospholipase C
MGAGSGMISSNPPGINCGQACSASFGEGTEVALTAAPMVDSFFAGWSGACTGIGACKMTLTKNVSAIASFNPWPVLAVTLSGSGKGSVASNPAGISCGPTCSTSFSPGTHVTLTATATTNSYFVGWTGGCSGNQATCTLTLSASQQVIATFDTAQKPPILTVNLAGTGTGMIASNPSGISCEPTCSASFSAGTQVTLTATPAAHSNFVGWAGGGCSGNSATCTLTLEASQQVTATFNLADVTALNHIIFMAQENRSFDHYFGAMREYWAKNGYPDQSFDGLPQFNPTQGIPPLWAPPPTNPGCDPAYPPPSRCIVDSNSPNIASYQLITQCIENPSPSWNESHVDWNLFNPLSPNPTLDGMVYTAAHDARVRQFMDTDGIRAMGYNDGAALNYYYFMATDFATSDRWFSPAMSRTPPNRQYLVAATSQGHAYAVQKSKPPLTATTIFQELQQAGITWKIYVNPQGSTCTGPPYDPRCLLGLSVLQDFAWGQTIPSKYPQNIAPISQYFTDLQNDALPQVVLIEPASAAGLDEHPANSDKAPVTSS